MSKLILLAVLFLHCPSFTRFAAAANQWFDADDGGRDGILYQDVRDYVSQDCANNINCTVAQTYGWPMNSWRVGSVTDMSNLFNGMEDFNEDIYDWVTSSVTNTDYMFHGATSFNGDVSAWSMSSVTTMVGMFRGAKSFNGSLSTWQTSNVTNMSNMFNGAKSFNSDLSAWNTSNVINMKYMFGGATSFNQNLCAWGDKCQYDDAFDIFVNSGCTYWSTPKVDQKGPFCASDCIGDTPTPAIALQSSVAVYYNCGSISAAVFSSLRILLGVFYGYRTREMT